jgi:hypothetical protein
VQDGGDCQNRDYYNGDAHLRHSLSASRAYPEPPEPTRLPAQIQRLLALPEGVCQITTNAKLLIRGEFRALSIFTIRYRGRF